MKHKVPYNNIYFCGECYFSNDLKIFLQKNIEANIENISIGSGSTDIFLTILKYRKYFEPGVFLLGGSIHDKWGWNNGETLKDIIGWFKTSLYNSSLVLCLTGPYDKTTDDDYDHRKTNEHKINIAESLKIPYLDLRISKENLSDTVHFNKQGQEFFFTQILDFLVSYKPDKQNPLIQNIQKTTDKIIVETCKRLTIIHDHNSSVLAIFNNEKQVKNLVPYRLLSENPDSTPYIDRVLYNNFYNPEIGTILFSEPVFVHATLTYY